MSNPVHQGTLGNPRVFNCSECAGDGFVYRGKSTGGVGLASSGSTFHLIRRCALRISTYAG